MTDDERWNAVTNCDESYDGTFFYAVKSTGIFCKPSCKSRTPKQGHVCYFDTKEAAEAAGFRPCKRCRSDLTEYEPVRELASQAKFLIDNCFAERGRLSEKMKQLGVSSSHLAVIFRKQYGVSPIEYLNRVRAEQSKCLLSDMTVRITDIAGRIGFESTSAFTCFFRKQTGMTPTEYRVRSRGERK